MKEQFAEQVYMTLQGQLMPEDMVSGVENIFENGGIGLKLYDEVLQAYQRICERLGVRDEDEDLEIIMRNMMEIEREVALRMYEYGVRFGNCEA